MEVTHHTKLPWKATCRELGAAGRVPHTYCADFRTLRLVAAGPEVHCRDTCFLPIQSLCYFCQFRGKETIFVISSPKQAKKKAEKIIIKTHALVVLHVRHMAKRFYACTLFLSSC